MSWVRSTTLLREVLHDIPEAGHILRSFGIECGLYEHEMMQTVAEQEQLPLHLLLTCLNRNVVNAATPAERRTPAA